MHVYYECTELETERTTYRQKLFEKFKTEYAEMNVTEQRVTDQKRVIEKNKLLDEVTLTNIRQEVARKINSHERGINSESDDQGGQEKTPIHTAATAPVVTIATTTTVYQTYKKK